MGSSPQRVRTQDYATRSARGQEDLQVLFQSVRQAFGQGGIGTKATERLLRRELGLLTEFGPRFTARQQALTEGAIQNDPRLRELSRLTQVGLKEITSGLRGGSALPADLRRTFTQEIRGAQAARGVLDSPSAGLEEAVRLAGGREAFRAQRIAQAAPFIGSGLGLGAPVQPRNFSILGQFAPSIGNIQQAQLQSSGLAFQQDALNAQFAAQAQQQRGQLLGAGIGLAGTVLTGGALGALGAAGFGGGFGKGALSGLGGFFGLAGGGQNGGFF